MRSTALRPYLGQLDHQDTPRFEEDIYARALEAYPPLDDGQVVLGFNRMFVLASK